LTSASFADAQDVLDGQYQIERELGRGGMGAVYLAREVRLDRRVAVKVLPRHLGANPELRERFLREARTAAQLSHPHIVPIFRADEVDGVAFFTMAYIEGENLAERVAARGPLPAAEAVRVLRETAWALAYAHARGVVHRDIKPENIMVERAASEAGIGADYVAMAVAELAVPAPITRNAAEVTEREERMHTRMLGTSERTLSASEVIRASPRVVLETIGREFTVAPYSLRLLDTVGGHPLDGGIMVFDVPLLRAPRRSRWVDWRSSRPVPERFWPGGYHCLGTGLRIGMRCARRAKSCRGSSVPSRGICERRRCLA